MQKIFIIMFIGLFIACSQEDSVRDLDHLYRGKAEIDIVNELGKPDKQWVFTMAEAHGEFRIELYNTYSPNAVGNEEVEIKEMQWKDGFYYITIWLHKVKGKWKGLDAVRWHRSVEF